MSNEVQFFQTRMGRTYFEHTAPELVGQLTKLNDILERLVELADVRIEPSGPDSRTTDGG